MTRTRVLVVDDAVVVRRLVSDVLEAEPDLAVAGTAPNGRIALAKIPQLNPDLVVLDVEMPDMDGIETLAALRREHPRLPVIMFSTLTERGAAITLEALLAGANDYVTKPANVGSVGAALARVREELVPKIRALCPAPTAATGAPPLQRPRPPLRRAGSPSPRIEAVGIGVSTGGPNALDVLIPALPADLGVPVFIAQHMPPMFTRLLAERLDAHSPLSVSEGVDGARADAGRAVVAPGDHHLALQRRGAEVRQVVHQGPRENSCRPSVDVLFRSLAEVYGGGVLGVVLTGMGADGVRGSEHITSRGGCVVVQDQASSVVWGMPGAVAAAGLADAVLPLSELAREITDRVRRSRVAARPLASR